jgi:hypothetical protein
MKYSKLFIAIGITTAIVLTACKKEVDKPADQQETTEDNSPPIGGATAVFKDTVSVKDGEVTITYAKSDACFPSNEIFSFTASAAGIPAGSKYIWEFGDGKSLTGTYGKKYVSQPCYLHDHFAN